MFTPNQQSQQQQQQTPTASNPESAAGAATAQPNNPPQHHQQQQQQDFTTSTTPSNPSPSSTHHSPPQIQRSNSTSQSIHAPSPHGLHARSCVTCRRRKVKCDKKYPCSNCVRAGGECVFPAPGRAPRRPRQGGPAGVKVVSEREAELLKRLRRLEGVVEELSGQVDGGELGGNSGGGKGEGRGDKQSPGSENSGGREREGSSEGLGGGGGSGSGGRGTVRVVGMDEGSGKRKDWIHRTLRIGGGPPKTAYSLDEVQTGVGRLVLDEGKSKYIASPYWWSTVTDEMEEIRGMLDGQEFDSDSDTPIVPNNVVTEPNHQSFIMGYNSSDVNLKGLHPLPSQIPFYWQTFVENVQPLVKIIHTQTMAKVIKEVQNNLENLEKSTEALMFSIYFATITSMNASEVQTNFGVSKEMLLRQYRFGTEQALAKAGFLNTSEIVTVQAFVLFLVCVRRHDDTKFVWSLTGLALRIAQSLGLHRDGTKFGLTPFNTEMRRRLWWQVCVLDTRASEDHGSDPSILDLTYDTQFPLSINDEDLDPDATEFPTPQPGVSEMTFCLIRYEICSLTRRLTYSPPGPNCRPAMTLEDKEAMIRSCAAHLETTYLQYCEDAGPLYWVAATVARLIVAKMSLIIYHPLTQPGKPNSLSQEIKDRLFMASIEIIEYSRILETEASTKHWGWLFHTYIQWHAIAYILGELCTRGPSEIVERAWRAVDMVFEGWKQGAIDHTKCGGLWQPMRKLMAKARRKREENILLLQQQKQQNGGGNGGGRGLEMGMEERFVRPQPTAYGKLTDCTEIGRDRLLGGEGAGGTQGGGGGEGRGEGGDAQGNMQQIDSIFFMSDTTTPSSNLAPSHNTTQQPHTHAHPQSQPQYSTQQQPVPTSHPQQPLPQTPWILQDSTLADLDLDMNGLDTEVSWEGWDDLVRDFQMEVDQSYNNAGGGEGEGAMGGGMGNMGMRPTFGGMGQWW